MTQRTVTNSRLIDGAKLDNISVSQPIDLDNVAIDGNVVHNTGDETVNGVKTFTSSPIVPTPTSGNQVATKDYVDSHGGSGSGDVTGPSSAVDSDIVLFDTTTGKKIKDSGESITSLKNYSDGKVSDTAYDATTWDGVTTIAPSKNAVRDKIESMETEIAGKMGNYNSVTKTSNYTAQPYDLVLCDVSAGSFTVTLPSAPANGTLISVKLQGIGTNKYLTLQTSGTDKFNTSTGNTQIYMYLFGEFAQLQYDSSTGLWCTFISAGTYNFATNFPGIDATTPISNADISINTTSRVLTITPPLGYFNIFVDGNGVITRFRKTGTINFPAFTDTSGIWYFYFDSSGTAVTTQTPWAWDSFQTICPVYRVLWNSTLSGSNKLVAQYVEYHQNTISAADHTWFHLSGAIWSNGFASANNLITSGSPNADGRNSVIALSSGTNIDDNLAYTITNSTGGLAWQQDLGNTTPASLNATNSALFPIFTQDGSGNISFQSATRYPFSWNSSTNAPEYITSTGTRTSLTTNGNYFVYFVYATQNPVNGQGIRIVSATTDFATLALAQAYTWASIQSTYPVFGNDLEIRPLYRLIFQYGNGYNVGAKKSALRQIDDIRKAVVANASIVSGSIPATSVTTVSYSDITATNMETAKQQLADNRVPTSRTLTINGTTYDLSADRSWTITGGYEEIVFQDYAGTAVIGILGTWDCMNARTLSKIVLYADTLPVGSNVIAELRKNSTTSGNILSATLQLTTSDTASNGRYVGTAVTSFTSASVSANDVLYLYLTGVGSTTPAQNVRAVLYYT